jgi:RHS repeat-associated protein
MVKSLKNGSNETTYTFDPFGNRTSVSVQGGPPQEIAVSVDLSDRAYDSAVSTRTDQDGNVWNRGQYTFQYDTANRLVKSRQDLGSGHVDIATYLYDGDGNRVRKTLCNWDGYSCQSANQDFTLDTLAEHAQVLDDGTWRYVWAEGRLLYQVRKSDNALYDAHLSPQGSLIGFSQWSCDPPNCSNGGVRWVARFENSEYGSHNGSTFGWESQLIRYTGHVYDKESNLNFMRARSQDPTTGRFLSRDTWSGSAVRSQSKNRYAYAEGNPASRVDPSGRNIDVEDDRLSNHDWGTVDCSVRAMDAGCHIVDKDGRMIGLYDQEEDIYTYFEEADTSGRIGAALGGADGRALGNKTILIKGGFYRGDYLWEHERHHLMQSRLFKNCKASHECRAYNPDASDAYRRELFRAAHFSYAICLGLCGSMRQNHSWEREAHRVGCERTTRTPGNYCDRPYPQDSGFAAK